MKAGRQKKNNEEQQMDNGDCQKMISIHFIRRHAEKLHFPDLHSIRQLMFSNILQSGRFIANAAFYPDECLGLQLFAQNVYVLRNNFCEILLLAPLANLETGGRKRKTT